MQSRQLVEILDRFLEAVKRVDKWRAVEKEVVNLEKAMSKAFAMQAKIVAKTFDASYRSYFQEAAVFDDDPIFTPAEMDSIEVMTAALEEAEKSMLETGGKALIATAALETSFDLKNPRAVQYLREHGADLVAKLNETTRDDMRHVLEYARENGWSYDKTAKAIQERYKGYYDAGSWWNFDSPRPQGHIDTRAHLIAVTESGNAYSAGEWMVAKGMIDAGLPMEKRWVAASDERDCEICDGNAAEDWIPAEDAFSSGDDYPLAHPACRCDAQWRRAEDTQIGNGILPSDMEGLSPTAKYLAELMPELFNVMGFSFFQDTLTDVRDAIAIGESDDGWEKHVKIFRDKFLPKHNVTDDIEFTLGLWGGPEPSFVGVLKGDANNIIALAKDWGRQYKQQAVAVLLPDPNGSGGILAWDFDKVLTVDELNKVLGGVQAVNVKLSEMIKAGEDTGGFDLIGLTVKQDRKRIEFWIKDSGAKNYGRSLIEKVFNISGVDIPKFDFVGGFDFRLLFAGSDY